MKKVLISNNMKIILEDEEETAIVRDVSRGKGKEEIKVSHRALNCPFTEIFSSGKRRRKRLGGQSSRQLQYLKMTVQLAIQSARNPLANR